MAAWARFALGLRGARLVELGPGLLREIVGERRHLRVRHVADERKHRLVRAIAELEFSDLTKEVRLMLTPDHRHHRVGWYPLLAVAGIAKRSLRGQVLGARSSAGRERKQHRHRRGGDGAGEGYHSERSSPSADDLRAAERRDTAAPTAPLQTVWASTRAGSPSARAHDPVRSVHAIGRWARLKPWDDIRAEFPEDADLTLPQRSTP